MSTVNSIATYEILNQNYLIFVKNNVEFESLKQNYDVVVEYSNLLALELSTSYREFQHLSSLFPNTMIPIELVRSQFSKLSQTFPNSGKIEINRVFDADFLRVSDLWDLGYNGTDVVVAVFDDGIEFSHPGLQGQNYSDPILFNEFNGQTEIPCKNHGTQVAGLIAGTTNGDPNYIGTGFGSKIVSMEMGCLGNSDLFGDPLAGFDWLASQNDTINILNISWGSGNGIIFEPIIDRLAKLGIITVTSAGNEGPNEYTILDPGSAISSIAVGAINYDNLPTSWSSLGPNLNFITKPDVLAPGLGLITTKNPTGYTTSPYFSGTSGSAPLVSGAIATLISGLNANNIPWNVGTIKAAIMRGAFTITGDEIKVGQGLVNLNATWNYLLNAVSDERGPQVLELVPSRGLPELFSNLPKGIMIDIPLTLISSHPDLVNIQFTGNLSQMLNYDGNTNSDFSQILNLHADTTGLTSGLYTGEINASIGDDFVLSDISISVSDHYEKKVLVDLRHTNWDTNGWDYYSGSNTGEMVKLAKNQNLWIQDSHSILTDNLLSQFDILWMPDPLDLPNEGVVDPDQLLQSEIIAITNFVNSGKSLFIDFLGSLTDNSGIAGTNSTAINQLILQFGITAKGTPVIDPTEMTIFPESSNSLTNNVTSFTHFGNYLDVDNNWQSVAGNEFGTVLAIYEDDSGGRVLVSSTNFWLDNTGVLGLYTSNGGIGDRELSINTWNWLSSNEVPDQTSFSTTPANTLISTSSSTSKSNSISTTSTSSNSDTIIGTYIIMVSITIIISSYNIRRRIK